MFRITERAPLRTQAGHDIRRPACVFYIQTSEDSSPVVCTSLSVRAAFADTHGAADYPGLLFRLYFSLALEYNAQSI